MHPLFQFLLPCVGQKLIAALGSISSCYYLKNIKGLIASYIFYYALYIFRRERSTVFNNLT